MSSDYDANYSPKYDDWSKDEYPPDWNNRSRIVRNRHNHRCQNCGAKYLPENDVILDVDHIVPKSQGGSHSLDNLQTLCRYCHARKHPDNHNIETRTGTAVDRPNRVLTAFFTFLYEAYSFLFVDSSTGLEAISPKQNRADITAEINQLWEPNHENMQQVGLLTDGEDAIRFTSWKNHEVKQVHEGATYSIEYASVREYEGNKEKYKGNPELVLDSYTEIERVD